MRNKWIALILGLCALFSIGYTFAYFTKNYSVDTSLSTDISDQDGDIITISNFEDLYRYTKAEAYNDVNPTSNISQRKTLKLKNNLVLEEDLYVTADIHLDLNGKILDLNEHTITFQHGYAGTLVIENGSISHGGKIVIDTPYASYVFDDVTYDPSIVEVVSMDPKLTAYNALYFVANALVNDVDERKERLSYDAIMEKETFALSDFIIERNECLFADINKNCVFVNSDIDLPYHYFSEDIQISYRSSDETIINNYGDLVSLPSSSATITLTATITHPDWSESIAVPFMIHVVNTSNNEVATNLATTLIKTRLQHRYIEDGEMVKYNGRDLFDDYYYFTSGMDLPAESLDFSLKYSYECLDDQKNRIVDTVFTLKDKVYRFEPNERCFYLVCHVTDDENVDITSFELPIHCTYITNEETIIRLLANELYGGSIIYDGAQESKHLYTIDEIQGMTQLPDYFEDITNVSYRLVDDAIDHYSLDGSNNLRTPGSDSDFKTTGLEMTVTFNNGNTKSIVLYIVYITGTGDTVSGYWTYYNEYHEQYVQEVLDSSFTMPFAYGVDGTYGAPYTVYDIAYGVKTDSKSIGNVDTTIYYSGENMDQGLTFGTPPGLKVELINEDETVLFTYSGSGSMTSEFNSWLGARKLSDLDSAKWRFSIDPATLTLEDIDITLAYNYSFIDNGSATSWLKYVAAESGVDYYTSLTTSHFTMEGGLVNVTGNSGNHVPDTTLYLWLYNQLNPNGTTITNSSDTYIQNDWLNKDVVFNANDINATNWYGIQFLDAITSVTFNDQAIDTTLLGYISDMASIENLSMDDCGLTTTILGTQLSNLKHLKNLSIINNDITLFDDALQGVENLESVYLYDEHDDGGGYHYANGMSNFQTYEDLQRRGVSVYYTLNNNNTPILFENANVRNDYQRLKDLEYQGMLSSSQNISDLYRPFSSLSAARLNINADTITWGIEPGEDESTATYFYVTVNNGPYEMKVKYYVDRY